MKEVKDVTNKRSTRDEQIAFLRNCGPTCSPRELAQVLGGNPYYYNVAAKKGTLNYDHEWHGRNLRIFTESVIKRIIGS